MNAFIWKDEKGIALISTCLVSMCALTLSLAVYVGTAEHIRHVNRELSKIRSYAGAEAGLQMAMVQIGQNAYTGFINTAQIPPTTLSSTGGAALGSYSVTMEYPQQADWVTIVSTATVDGETRSLEGRVFLDSHLSKYLVYSTLGNFVSGANAKYGISDGIHPEGIPEDGEERASMYFKGNYTARGSNVSIFGDVNAENEVIGNASTVIHGDTYAGNFQLAANGSVQNDGVTGVSSIRDGFSDDFDRDGNGAVNAQDAPDRHDLTASGGGDSHAKETLKPIDLNFYKNHNDISAFGGSTSKDRFILLKSGGNNTTVVEEYKDLTWQQLKTSYPLPEHAIVYVNGDVYIKSGQIDGRVSVVSSENIILDGDVKYAKAEHPEYADAEHAAAFMARDEIYLRSKTNQNVSGIFYAQNVSGGSTAIEAAYDTKWNAYGEAQKGTLNVYGNRVMNGQADTSVFQDRTFAYDPNLKYYRPPGIPVNPSVKVVREVALES